MEAAIERLIGEIHHRPGQVALVVAGAGSQFLAWLLGVAGASRTLLEAQVTYASSAFDQYLGQSPVQYVAPETATMLAGRALNRARRLGQETEPLIGLACTATIATDRPKRGDHRCHVATWTAECVRRYSLTLEKGARDRAGEEEAVSRLILRALAAAYGLESGLPLLLRPGERVRPWRSDLLGAAQRLHRGEVQSFAVTAAGRLRRSWRPRLVLSGAFNPLHEGHLALARAAQELTGRPAAFELAVANAGKPTIGPDETLARLAQFAGAHLVVASSAPRFDQKAQLYPGAAFVVGYDTAARVLQKRYYQDSEDMMWAALDLIRDAGCCFLVAGRAGADGRYHPAEELSVPEPYRDLFRPIPQEQFRFDISSTVLRHQESYVS
jgi:hypothetical protein